MNFNFGEVLSRAWQIVWKHKVLWIFGILASCGQASSGYNSGSNSGGGNGGFGNGPTNLPPQVERFFNMVAENATGFIAIAIAVVCIIWIVAIFLGTIGRIGLIRGAWQAEGGAEHLIFGQLFSESTPYFWRIFGLSLIPAIPVLFLFVLFIIGFGMFAVSADRAGGAGALGMLGMLPVMIGCLCLLVPILWVVKMIFTQSERAIVLEDAFILPSISRGWDIFRANLGPIILLAIILGVINLVVGFIIAIPVLVVVVPAVIAFAAGEAQNWRPVIFAAVCVCLYAPVSWLINGVAIAFRESAWTLTFMRLTNKPDGTVTPEPVSIPPQTPDDSDKTVISLPHA
jgi:hypothetical protein